MWTAPKEISRAPSTWSTDRGRMSSSASSCSSCPERSPPSTCSTGRGQLAVVPGDDPIGRDDHRHPLGAGLGHARPGGLVQAAEVAGGDVLSQLDHHLPVLHDVGGALHRDPPEAAVVTGAAPL